MQRFVAAAVLLTVVVVSCVPAEANWLESAWASVCRDFKRNNYWPKPFTDPDREAAVAPFAVMVDNGWKLQNTLGDQHFDETNNQLTEAGELKLRSILTEAPVEYRTVFILRGNRPEITSARLQSVHDTAANILPQGELAEVAETDKRPHYWPAEYVDDISRARRSTIPSPRLPVATSGDSGN